MFCNACGNELAAGQNFCSKCGKSTLANAPASWRSRFDRHASVLGILWLLYSGFSMIGGFFLLATTSYFARHAIHPFWFDTSPRLFAFMAPFLGVIAFLKFLRAAAGIAAGFGLLQRATWARTLAIVVAAFSLLNLPFGTALGIYTLCVLLPSESRNGYPGASSQATSA